jgi:hypothetical protein
MGLPDDAGELTLPLRDVLEHIPEEWGRSLRVHRGWYQLVLRTHAKLLELDPSYEALQIKEKFGGLRYYHRLTNAADASLGWSIEAEAEIESYTICELCGQSGTLHKNTTYWQTLCQPCFEERQAERATRGLT